MDPPPITALDFHTPVAGQQEASGGFCHSRVLQDEMRQSQIIFLEIAL